MAFGHLLTSVLQCFGASVLRCSGAFLLLIRDLLHHPTNFHQKVLAENPLDIRPLENQLSCCCSVLFRENRRAPRCCCSAPAVVSQDHSAVLVSTVRLDSHQQCTRGAKRPEALRRS